jgi:hypothetical protein
MPKIEKSDDKLRGCATIYRHTHTYIQIQVVVHCCYLVHIGMQCLQDRCYKSATLKLQEFYTKVTRVLHCCDTVVTLL